VDDFFNAVSQEVSDPIRTSDAAISTEKESQAWKSRQLDLLYQEYRSTIEAVDRQLDHVIRVATIGFSATGALLVLASTRDFAFEEWIFWLAPLMLALLYAWIINHLYHMGFASYYVREIEDDIAKRIGVSYFHHQNTVTRALSSFRTGFPPYLITGVLGLLFAFTIYVALVTVSFFKLRDLFDAPVWRQVAFATLHLFLSAALIIAGIGIGAPLRVQFNKWKSQPGTNLSLDDRRFRDPSRIKKVVGYAVLPRVFDFVYKALITIGSFLVTTFVLHIPLSRDLFLTGFLVVFCFDFLAKQATYIWNDVLDVESDRIHSYKGSTRLLSILQQEGHRSDRIGIALFVFRAVAALVVALVLAAERDLVWLPALILFTFVWQFVYDRWGKRRPLRRVIVAAIGYAERALAGSLAAMSVTGQYDATFTVLLSTWVIIYMFAVLSEYWWAERHMQWKERFSTQYPKLPTSGTYQVSGAPRIWFLEQAPRFERRANGVLFFVGLFLAYFYAEHPSGRMSALVDFIGGTIEDVRNVVADQGNLVLGAIGSLSEVDVFRNELIPTELAVTVVGGSIAGILFLRAVWQLVKPEKRPYWLAGIVAVLVALVIIAPSDLKLAVVAFIAPLVVAIVYYELTYDEITRLDKLFRQMAGTLPTRLIGLLFHPRGARISIQPVGSEPTDNPGEWLADLHQVYTDWSTALGLKTHSTKGDGGGPFDLLIEGPLCSLQQLRGESGLHRRVIEITESDGTAHTITQIAKVEVRPVSVVPHPSMGNGLETSKAIEKPASKDSRMLRPVRHYRCNASRDSNAGLRLSYLSIYEPDEATAGLQLESVLSIRPPRQESSQASNRSGSTVDDVR
jgi:hypothetical protein